MSAVRLRLTAFYAALLAATSALMLGVSYLFVRGRLQGTLDADAAREAVATLASQYVVAGIAIVLLAVGGGWLVSGQVLDPLARAIALQRRFVANASHELRTPMTAIRVGAEVALDDPDASVASLRATLHETIAATEETDRLTSALLALASSTDGAREDEPVALRDVVLRVLPRSPRIDAALDETTVRGDAGLLGRAAANLVDNALRHGPPGGTVAVRLRGSELTVSNPGAPIAPEDLARLAQPFERLGRRTTPGSGLGLSIVQAIAEAHGGRLTLEAPPAGGLVARLALPAA